MTNFSFLKAKTEYALFAPACMEAEKIYVSAPAMCAVGCRKALELAVKWVYAADKSMKMPYKDNLQSLIHEPTFRFAVDSDTWGKMPFIIKLGNLAVHTERSVQPSDALASLRGLFEFVQWIDYCYGADYQERTFDKNLVPTGKVAVDTRKIKEQESLLDQKDAEIEALRKQIEQMSTRYTAEKEQHQKERTFQPEDLSEFKTRKIYIDVDLKLMGWKFTGPDADVQEEYRVEDMAGMPGQPGFCDYVLFGKDGLPLAVVEAKRTSKDPNIGRKQAVLYADCLERKFGRRPMMFTTNGFETYFWDDQTAPQRKVSGIFSKDDLQKLMNRPDVDSLVNSCDSGREGELIFRLVYEQAGCKKPFSRLWLSSMEENAIREGFAHLKPSTEYDALYNAALCRERADWMVGINASRLFSCLYGQPLAVGRVMTPVLAMTVVREAAIAAFVPEKFYTVDLELTSGCTASSRRIPEKTVAENLLEACRKEMVATIQRITRKEKSENPPPLYDLTTLQRDANRLLGYSAQQTLDYVQSLYEKKLTTYPRTDSCYITDDDEEMLEELTEELEGFLDIAPEDVDEAVPRTRRTVNREKVTDHHAILPTRSMLQADLEALPKGEQNILKLIIARTLMAVSKPFRYLETLLTTECAGEEFTAKGKEVLEEGWKAVERKVLADILNRKQELTALPNAAENECGILNAELKEGQTSPPKHFTDVIFCERKEWIGIEERSSA